jgi:hypothetical protein
MRVLLFLLPLFLLSCQPKELPSYLEYKDGYAILKISHQTSRDELFSYAEALKEQGIEIDFSKSTFFDNDRLQNLSLFVKTPDGNSGNTSADQTNLQFKYFGFLYQKNGNPSFKIGEI